MERDASSASTASNNSDMEHLQTDIPPHEAYGARTSNVHSAYEWRSLSSGVISAREGLETAAWCKFSMGR